jgi:hypothetical protein
MKIEERLQRRIEDTKDLIANLTNNIRLAENDINARAKALNGLRGEMMVAKAQLAGFMEILEDGNGQKS